MQVLTTSESEVELSRALRMMHAALEILDEIDAPGDIASHLDLAICRLERSLGTGPHAKTGVQTLFCQLQNELAKESFPADPQANPWELEPK